MTEEDLINACTDLGVHVVFVPLDLAGAYVHELNLILIGSRLPASSQRAVLAHEYIHATRGHQGPQEPHIEARVDREAARLLISPAEYVLAEHLYGPNTAAIADELNLPTWIVEAYQEDLQACPIRSSSSTARSRPAC
ncbi:ImmA/IrrE family metallo-endopeptidase [Trueperella pyogenes]|uniref:ImmA/IrrE family metallo-endopeptidase n=1 Tax=Trueperella pyogenes TaxID=1661 RepID=UPI001432B9FB|nr:ImmA/IrrE family metallo-endopeptidase [Trueperella pyogenes]QIU87103.1 ImmA/IrrE family metallo-endopeptidase [Trueperella pyogenes]